MNTTVRSKSMLDTTKSVGGASNLDTTQTQPPMVLRQRQVNPGIPSSPARSQSVQGNSTTQSSIQNQESKNSNPSTPKRSAPIVPMSRTPIMNRPPPGPPLPRPVLPRERGYMDRVVEYLVSDLKLFIILCKIA